MYGQIAKEFNQNSGQGGIIGLMYGALTNVLEMGQLHT